MTEPVAAPRHQCASCGSELAPALLSCPQCHALVHAARLRSLADEATAAAAAGDDVRATRLWREAFDLLPERAQQRTVIGARLEEIAKRAPLIPRPTADGGNSSGASRAWMLVVAIGIFALSKAKLLVLGLTKLGTLSSMLVFLGVYWSLYGWKFALGFVISIYIHEMGHVAALTRFGIAASAPMFIPGIGALVRMRQAPANVHEDARVGLAGPLWGTIAAALTWGVFLATRSPIWSAIAHTAAWLNLFNLAPIWQLDGGRGFRALTRDQRWLAVGILAATFWWSRDGMLGLVGLVAIWAAFQPAPRERDWGALLLFAALIVALAALMAVTSVTAGTIAG